MADEDRFAQIVSIGAHDLSTPLATVYGFAKTLAKTDLDEPAARYVEMIEAASAQLKELVDELSLVTRIERGRYSPMLTDVDALELAREACAELGERVQVGGEGATVRVEPEVTSRALSRLAKAASRHGGIDSVTLVVRGSELEISPLLENAAGVVTGSELRELGAVVAVEHLKAIGATVAAEDERLVIRFPA
jgi:signal transduction histidine kinase